jgi:hypothetical protein
MVVTFAYRVAFVPKVGAKASRSDAAIEFVKPGTLGATLLAGSAALGALRYHEP